MNMIVLPRIEIDNPFGALAETLKDHVLPFITQLAMNKEQIVKLSDKELTDYIPILKQFAPDSLTQDGKIDWSKIEEYAKSEDPFKQQVANYLSEVKKMREEYTNLPLVAKLEQMNYYSTATNPLNLKKSFMVKTVADKYNEALDKANLPEEAKLLFRAFAPEFAEKVIEKPEYFNTFLKILEGVGKKKQDTTQQGGGTGSWRLSLDEQQKKFGIKLEEPQLTPPQVSPPQILVEQKSMQQKPVVKQGSGRVGGVKQNKQTKEQKQQPQSTSNQKGIKFYIDGVEYTVRPKKSGGYEVLSVKEVPPQEPLFFDPTLWFSGLLGQAGSKVSSVVGKVKNVFSKTPKPPPQQAEKVAENVAKETAQNVASQQAKTEAQNVVGQASKYDKRREEVRKRIEEQVKRNRGDWQFATSPKQVNPEEVRKKIIEEAKKSREEKLPVLASKETRWEFSNAKPPAVVFREGRITDYIPPQFEKVSVKRLKELIKQKKLPTPKGETTIRPAPKETPYKETVAKEGFKTTEMLEEFLKKGQSKVETRETVLKPIKNLKELIKEIPEEAKNDPEIRRRFVEITRDVKKISSEAPFRDVSDDLKVLGEKVNELKDLLKKQYSKTATEKTTKKKKSNK
jgi:hypothetical protein